MTKMNRDQSLIAVGYAIGLLVNHPKAKEIGSLIRPRIQDAAIYLAKYHGEPLQLDKVTREAVSFIIFSIICIDSERASKPGGEKAGKDQDLLGQEIVEQFPGWNRELMRQVRALEKLQTESHSE